MTRPPFDPKKNSPGEIDPRYEHGWAIVRIDDFLAELVPSEERVKIKKVVWSRDEAEAEVARLNNLKKGKGSRYFVHVVRVVKK